MNLIDVVVVGIYDIFKHLRSSASLPTLSLKRPTNFAQRLLFRLEVLLRAVNLRHGTNGFTSLPKEVILRIFTL